MSPPKIAKPKGPVARFAWAADTADGYAASSSETLVPADERRALAEGQEVELDEHGTKGLIAEVRRALTLLPTAPPTCPLTCRRGRAPESEVADGREGECNAGGEGSGITRPPNAYLLCP